MGKKRTAGKADYVLGLNKKAFEAGLKAAQKRFKAVGRSLTSIGAKSLLFGGVAAAGIAATVKAFADFDDQMRTVKAVTGATEKQFAQLTEVARELGRTTSFTASQVAALQTILGRAGFDTSQIENLTGNVLDLTRAVGGELETTAGFFASAIRQFGLGSDEGARVADALTVAANASFNSIDTLGEALKFAGPVAADFNLSIEETLAVLGGLGNVGIQGSAAGTALRRLLIVTGAEAKKLKKIFGVSFVDSSGNARNLVTVLDEVNSATANLGTAARAAKFNEAFGLLGITGASVLAKNAVSVRELFEEIKAGKGAAAKTAKEIESGIGGSIRRTLSAIEGLVLAIGEPLAEPLSKFSQAINASLGVVNKFIEQNKFVVIGFAALTAATLTAGVSLTALGFAFLGISSALGVIASPIGLTVIAIGGLVAAFFTLTSAGSKTAGFLATTFGTLSQVFKGFFDAIKNAFAAGDLELAAEIAFEGMKLAIVTILDEILKAFGTSVTEMIKLLQRIPNALKTTVTGVSAAIQIIAAKAGKTFGVDTKVFNAGIKGFAQGLDKQIGKIDVEGFTDSFLNKEEIEKRLDALKDKAKQVVEETKKVGEAAPEFAFDAPEFQESVAKAKKALSSVGSFSVADVNRRASGNPVADAIKDGSKKQVAKLDEVINAINASIIRYSV